MCSSLICLYISALILLTGAKSLPGKSDLLKTKLWNLHVKFQKSAEATGSALTETHFETRIKTICKNSGCLKEFEDISGSKKKCPEGWKSFDGNCYKLLSKSASWSVSKRSCQALNSNLVRINSEREGNWIYKTFKGAPSWIDATDVLQEGTWRWSSTGKALTYTAWKKGEPNNASNEDCAFVYYSDGKPLWNDVTCRTETYALCQKTP